MSLTEGPLGDDPDAVDTAPGPPRPPEALAEAFRDAAAAGEAMVELVGHEVASRTDWHELAALARAQDVKLAVAAPADPAFAAHAAGVGVEVLVLGVHGPPDAAARAVRDLPVRPRLRVRTRLGPGAVDAVDAFADAAETITLVGAGEPEEVDRCWRVARGRAAELHFAGAHLAPTLDRGAARPLDAALVRLREQGAWLPGLFASATPDDAVAPRRYADALGLTAPAGGTVRDPVGLGAERVPTVLVVPALGDHLLAVITLPALANALQGHGVPTRLASVWGPPWNLRAPAAYGDPDVRLTDLLRGGIDTRWVEVAARLESRFLDSLDLGDAARVVVAGWRAAHAVWRHPTLRADAAVEVIDLHLLDGIETWIGAAARPEAGDWWPGPRWTVRSCFPAYAAAYRRVGVPIEQLRWSPYPVARAALPPRRGGDRLLAPGTQRRALTLLAAAAAATDGAPIEVITGGDVPETPRLSGRGVLPLADFVDAIARARGVVLPVAPHADHAAGSTVAALARGLGVPVVGTRAWGLVDHLHPGRDAWLTAPHAPSLAEGIARLDAAPSALEPDAAGVDVTAWVIPPSTEGRL